MKKCVRCKKRKGKRYCPALRETLCSLCCGLLREKKIHCPPGCLYLAQHKSYQEKKSMEKNPDISSWEDFRKDDILKDERMAWLALHIEIPLGIYAAKKESFTDKDALLALNYAKEKLQKEKSLILLSSEESQPKNEIGEEILRSMENCSFQRNIIIPGESPGYRKEEKIKCLERIILSLKFSARKNLEERNYLESLLERIEKLREFSKKGKILIT